MVYVIGESPRVDVADLLDCEILGSSSYFFHFRTIFFILTAIIKNYHYWSSTKMSFVLNNPWRLMCH